jgi:hypothetical protein
MELFARGVIKNKTEGICRDQGLLSELATGIFNGVPDTDATRDDGITSRVQEVVF